MQKTMLETLIHYHNLPDQSPSTDEFQTWKDNPVTKQLLKELSSKCLQGMLDEPSTDPQEASANLYKRDGAIIMISEILMYTVEGDEDES